MSAAPDNMPDPDSLRAALEAVVAGEPAALDRLVAMTQRALRGWAATYASSAEMVEQVVQALYGDVLAACEAGFTGETDPVIWMQGLAEHRMGMELQDRIRILRFQNEEVERFVAETGLMLLQRMPMAIDRGAEAMDDIDDCLESLDRRSRRLLAGFYADKRSLAQMSVGYRHSRSRLTRLLSRVRSRARRRLAATGVMP